MMVACDTHLPHILITRRLIEETSELHQPSQIDLNCRKDGVVTLEYGLLWKRRRMIVNLLVLLFSIEYMLCCT
jgi:hypothetical protein